MGEVLDWIVPTVASTALAGVIWLFVEAWNRRSDSRDINTRMIAVEKTVEAHNSLPVRMAQIETVVPMMQKTTDEIKEILVEVQRGQQRLEVAIVRNFNKTKSPDNDA